MTLAVSSDIKLAQAGRGQGLEDHELCSQAFLVGSNADSSAY